jgi:hypothetical protein
MAFDDFFEVEIDRKIIKPSRSLFIRQHAGWILKRWLAILPPFRGCFPLWRQK